MALDKAKKRRPGKKKFKYVGVRTRKNGKITFRYKDFEVHATPNQVFQVPDDDLILVTLRNQRDFITKELLYEEVL